MCEALHAKITDMFQKIPVIAAVPNYNMAESLKVLLPQLLAQSYDAIYVLDDASTDDSVAVAQSFGSAVRVIQGTKRLGSAGSRNRLLAIIQSSKLAPETIINFVDADVEILPGQRPLTEISHDLMEKYPKAGVICPKVLNNDGAWGAFNYGPSYSWLFGLRNILQARIEIISKSDMPQAQKLWKRYDFLLHGFTYPFLTPKAKQPGHIVECFMLSTVEAFRIVNGFDGHLPYLEGILFCEQLKRFGYEVWFDPRFTVKHTQKDVRGWGRYRDVTVAALKLPLRRIIQRLQS